MQFLSLGISTMDLPPNKYNNIIHYNNKTTQEYKMIVYFVQLYS